MWLIMKSTIMYAMRTVILLTIMVMISLADHDGNDDCGDYDHDCNGWNLSSHSSKPTHNRYRTISQASKLQAWKPLNSKPWP